MSRRRQMMVGMVLGALGLLGLAVAAMGQAGNLAADRAWYEKEVKKLTKESTADEIIALARECYRKGLKDEAMTHAIEAHKKAPDDLRPKYLIFALSGAKIEITIEPPLPPSVPTKATMTDAEVEAVYKAEGEQVVRNFQQVQRLMATRCGSPKCHGGGNPKSKWALVLKGPANRKSIAQNFRTVYTYMNRDKPKESALLQKPLKGTEAGHPAQAIRSDKDATFTRIEAYIDTVKTDAQKAVPW